MKRHERSIPIVGRVIDQPASTSVAKITYIKYGKTIILVYNHTAMFAIKRPAAVFWNVVSDRALQREMVMSEMSWIKKITAPISQMLMR